MFRLNPRSRCNNSSRCCYPSREHVDPAWSRRIRHGGDSHPEMSSSPGSVGLARAHPRTKTQAMEPSRQTWSSYGPPYPLGRWSLYRLLLYVYWALTLLVDGFDVLIKRSYRCFGRYTIINTRYLAYLCYDQIYTIIKICTTVQSRYLFYIQDTYCIL